MTKTEIRKLLADLQEARNARLAYDAKSKKLKVAEDTILDQLTAANVPGGTYGPYLLDVTHKRVPRCTDWESLHAFIKQENAFELLHKRLTESAIMERINAGDMVPGIVTDDKVTYKVSAN